MPYKASGSNNLLQNMAYPGRMGVSREDGNFRALSTGILLFGKVFLWLRIVYAKH